MTGNYVSVTYGMEEGATNGIRIGHKVDISDGASTNLRASNGILDLLK